MTAPLTDSSGKLIASAAQSTLTQYVAAQAPLVEGLGNERLERFGLRVARATGWTVVDFAAAPAALKQGVRGASRPGLDAPVPSSADAPPAPPPDVSGFKIEEKIASVARATTPLEPWPYVAIAFSSRRGSCWKAAGAHSIVEAMRGDARCCRPWPTRSARGIRRIAPLGVHDAVRR